ncbi:hypothetical protein A2U01_0013031 [Trifolium medium]|uniref:Uncharacterized protein n=1 Tax=Trifolium medium TaxID=97028 RepID=A0A392MZG6_9FABA|nr:hypothetical protein [Trifolium medium]
MSLFTVLLIIFLFVSINQRADSCTGSACEVNIQELLLIGIINERLVKLGNQNGNSLEKQVLQYKNAKLTASDSDKEEEACSVVR